jgi:hypothetical protein
LNKLTAIAALTTLFIGLGQAHADDQLQKEMNISKVYSNQIADHSSKASAAISAGDNASACTEGHLTIRYMDLLKDQGGRNSTIKVLSTDVLSSYDGIVRATLAVCLAAGKS